MIDLRSQRSSIVPSVISLASLWLLFFHIGTNNLRFLMTKDSADSNEKTEENSEVRFFCPSTGIISQGFRRRQHEGLDIAGAIGTPIYAAVSGVVLRAGWEDTGLGNAVNIQHPDGRVTVYGHNQKVLVRTGQRVNQGQMIAKMGSTGNSSGPHLHFEVYQQNTAINPIGYCKDLPLTSMPTKSGRKEK